MIMILSIMNSLLFKDLTLCGIRSCLTYFKLLPLEGVSDVIWSGHMSKEVVM